VLLLRSDCASLHLLAIILVRWDYFVSNLLLAPSRVLLKDEEEQLAMAPPSRIEFKMAAFQQAKL
jgi:hypothetical protein